MSPPRRSAMRPTRPRSPIPITLSILLVWWVVARNSGSGWVQVLGDVVFGLVTVGLLGPAFALARLEVEVVRSPVDAGAGTPASIAVEVSGRARVRPVAPAGPYAFVGPSKHVEVTLLPVRRGCYDHLELEIATAAPFGLQWWSRQFLIALPNPLHVAPRLGSSVAIPDGVDERFGAAGTPTLAETGDARGVRDYRPGDRRRRVHWAASAHAGRLMVRQMEDPSSLPVVLRVTLPHEADARERSAEQALGTAVRLIDRGVHLVLVTMEPSGETVGPVVDRRGAGRRLARAVAGGSHPPGLDVER